MPPLSHKEACGLKVDTQTCEVYSPHHPLLGIWPSGGNSTISSPSSSKIYPQPGAVLPKVIGAGRYVIDLSGLAGPSRGGDSVSLRFGATKRVFEHADSEGFDVTVHFGSSRVYRNRGWRRLKVRRSVSSQGDIPDVNAFQVYDQEKRCSTIVVLSQPDAAIWMGDIPDDTPLGELCMPGTHESCALYGFPISQCQQPATSIEIQLLDGIRYLDVRLRVVGDELLMYHGPRPQRSSLPILLHTLHTFLTLNPTETFILCLKEESPPFHPDFAQLVYKAFAPHSRFWYLENRVPSLGEVRGRGMLMTRFEATQGTWEQGLGIHPSTWPDSRQEGFMWDCSGTTVRTQDWYRVKTFLEIPEKFRVIVNHLTPTLVSQPDSPFTLSYTSASYFPLSLPTTIAKGFGWPDWGLGIYGINQRMLYWLLVQISRGNKVRACLPMDFYRQCGDERGLAEILISMNFL